MGSLQFGSQALVFGFVEARICVFELRFFRSSKLAGNQIGDVWQTKFAIQLQQIRIYFTVPHRVNAGQNGIANRKS